MLLKNSAAGLSSTARQSGVAKISNVNYTTRRAEQSTLLPVTPSPRLISPVGFPGKCSVRQQVSVAAVAGAPPVAPPVEMVEVDSVTVHPIGTSDENSSVLLLRGNCKNRLKYEVEYSLKRGTTDNCYLVKVPGATALVDVPFEAYTAKFMSTLESVVPPNQLTHVIITYMDPKAIPSLEALLGKALVGRPKGAPKLQVVLSNPAVRLLQSVLGDKPEKAELLTGIDVVVARSNACINVGGTLLETVLTPTPRWPDLMSVYFPERKLLFSSKMFGAHVSPAAVNEDGAPSAYDVAGWDMYGADWQYYYETLLAPQSRQINSALDKMQLVPVPEGNAGPKSGRLSIGDLGRMLRDLFSTQFPAPSAKKFSPTVSVDIDPHSMDVTTVCPMHGPVVNTCVSHLLTEYGRWTREQMKVASANSVAVLYASAYGNTATLAQALSRGVTKGGVGVEMINLETASVDEVVKAVTSSNGFMIGSPTLGGHMPTQVSVAMGAIIREPSTKAMPCGVFGSFGWSGEAVDEMEQRLRDAGFQFAYQPVRVKFRPTAKDLQLCEESGRDLAVACKRKAKAKEAMGVTGSCVRQALASGVQLAMGRVVGSLSVITAKDEDASSAMLASWVSQASFDPPGITIAIKRDRAMEPLMITGGKFAVSMVPEGVVEKKVMKALSRPFSPGEDRLAALDTIAPEGVDAPVLKDCASYMWCEVASRMEAGDHIIVYANVLTGKVVTENALTAVHHRKVGNHY